MVYMFKKSTGIHKQINPAQWLKKLTEMLGYSVIQD